MLRDSHRAGINNLAMMIFGLPGSDRDALDQTLDLRLIQAEISSGESQEFVPVVSRLKNVSLGQPKKKYFSKC